MHGIDSVLKARSVNLLSAPVRPTLARKHAVTPDVDESESEGFLGFTKEAVDAAFRSLIQGVPH